MSKSKKVLAGFSVLSVIILLLAVPMATAYEFDTGNDVDEKALGVAIYDAYLSKTQNGDPVDPHSFWIGETVYIVVSYGLTRSGDLTEIYISRGPALGFDKQTSHKSAGVYEGSWGFEVTEAGRGIFSAMLKLEPIGFASVSLPYWVEISQTIRLGITSSSTEAMASTTAVAEIAKQDINEFCSKIGYPYYFDFVLKDNQGTAAIALENTQWFKQVGIDLIIGHGWSSQCQISLSYVNENNMILLSSSSTSPILAIADDNLFRLCPTDYVQAPALAEMWYTWGADAVLTMQRGDIWGDGLYNIFESELADRGIVNLGRIRYAGEVTEFSSYLATANDIITDAVAVYGIEKVGMQFFSFAEHRTIQNQAADYPNLINIIWMTTESGGRSQAMLDEAGEWAVRTRHFSPLMRPAYSPEWYSLADRYYEATGSDAGFYVGAQYDAAWIMALSVILSRSKEGSVIKEVLPEVAAKYYGVTGWCALDENGDRLPQMFDIWGFYEDSQTGEYKFREFGKYDGVTQDMMWDYEALWEYAGLIPPKIQ